MGRREPRARKHAWMMTDEDSEARAQGPGLFGGFFANMFGGVEESSPDKARVVNAVRVSSCEAFPRRRDAHSLYVLRPALQFCAQCSQGCIACCQITAPGGWDLSLEIGSQVARQLGGSGQLAKGDVMTVGIGVGVRLTLDEGYDPPQGDMYTARQLVADQSTIPLSSDHEWIAIITVGSSIAGSVFIDSDSKIFQGEGFWSVVEDTDDNVPTAFQVNLHSPLFISPPPGLCRLWPTNGAWARNHVYAIFQANLKCPEGISVSGDLVVPPGNVYVNFKIKTEPAREGAPVRCLRLLCSRLPTSPVLPTARARGFVLIACMGALGR
jgi:hypothetical protein